MTGKSDADVNASNSPKRPSGLWGQNAAAFYARLRNRAITVQVVTGERYKGILVGVDVYDIVIRQANGLEMLLAKGNIIYVHPSIETREL